MSGSCNGDAAVYVLGALEEHEVAGFVEHMDSCAVCRDEVLSLQVVADVLPATVAPVAAPAGLKRHVMAIVEADAKARRRHEAAASQPSAGARRRWRSMPAFASSMAFAAAAAAVVLIASPSGVRRTASPHSAPSDRVVVAHVFSAGSTGRAALHESGTKTELVVSRFPPPPAGHVYQVWLSRPGQSKPSPTNAFFNVGSDGSATVDVPGSLRGVQAVLVTPEPIGGSQVPTGKRILRAPLT